jgi:hypothetical protein
MNKRQRKKYLKEKGLYVMNKELWNLDYTIAEWILPRLKLYKAKTIGYPSIDRKVYSETKKLKNITFEDWQNILDEIILGFEQILIDPLDIAIDKNLDFKNKTDYKIYEDICNERQEKIERGLDLFKYYIQDLWW